MEAIILLACLAGLACLAIIIRPKSQPASAPQHTTRAYTVDIVGESYCQPHLNKVAGGKTEDSHELETTATLRPYHNEHDPNAVEVLIKGGMAGHLSRTDAKKYRQKHGQKITTSVPAMITGGWYRGHGDEGNYGVKLDIDL